MQLHRAILCGLAAVSLAACDRQQVSTTTTKVDRQLSVTGARDDVERFVALQRSLRPPLETAPVEQLADGRATAVVTIPADRTGKDLVHTTREALAAGLDYKLTDFRSTVTLTR